MYDKITNSFTFLSVGIIIVPRLKKNIKHKVKIWDLMN